MSGVVSHSPSENRGLWFSISKLWSAENEKEHLVEQLKEEAWVKFLEKTLTQSSG